MAVYPVRRRLPTAHSTQIGRIITRWAVLEWQLKNIAYALLNIGPKEGRLAVRETRVEKYIDMIEDLMKLKGLPVPDDLADFKTTLKILESHSNRLAHSIWIRHPDFKEPVMQLLKGKWQPNPKEPKRTVSRLIEPEAVLIRLKELREFALLIDQGVDAAGRLEKYVTRALQSSRQKSS